MAMRPSSFMGSQIWGCPTADGLLNYLPAILRLGFIVELFW